MTFSMMVPWCIARAGVLFQHCFVTFVTFGAYPYYNNEYSIITCMTILHAGCEGCSSSIIRYPDVQCESRPKADLLLMEELSAGNVREQEFRGVLLLLLLLLLLLIFVVIGLPSLLQVQYEQLFMIDICRSEQRRCSPATFLNVPLTFPFQFL